MSITINLEIGHNASLRTKTTPEGFTHDWEVFVKGCNGAEIHYYVEKVVFHLHETFPKPKRVVKEPPYSLRTSGYAGFNLPIDIYLKNNQEPKKIRFNYDLQLQPRGPPIHNVQKEKYVFYSPSEEFRSKLLKGGGIVGTSGSSQEINEIKSLDEKNQMTSKPKLGGSEAPKKHKMKLDEPRNTDFLNLFGTPITKTTSKAPEAPKPKEPSKSTPKVDKPVEKDKSKTKSPHKDKEKDKSKDKDKSDTSEKKKEEKRKSKEEKSKDRDRAKEKSSKKDKEREKTPRPRSPSPKRSPKRPVSPATLPPPKHSSSKEKEPPKEERKEKERKEEKKSKKEKREHKESKHKDRDKDKEHKEHKSRDSKSGKDTSSVNLHETSPNIANVPPAQPQQKISPEKKEKSKESLKEPKDEEKTEKPRSEKSEDKQKHKHKKKDRKEKREDKHSSKSEKKKEEKPPVRVSPPKEEPREPPPVTSTHDTDKSSLFGSPKSEPPATPTEVGEKAADTLMFKDEEASNDSVKASSRESSPPPPQTTPASPPEPAPEPVKKPEPEKKKEESTRKKEKKEKKKDKKDRDHEKKRKRKSPQTHVDVEEQPPEKIMKEEENNNSDDEGKVTSTADANPLPECDGEEYMILLRDLQHKIMGIKDNSDLQKVVQLIAETGRYEISAHTFDFDLCLLDRSTVKQLQDFIASIS